VKVLYLSYNGLAEPLGSSQILPYIRGLAARGHAYTVISFEKPASETTLTRAEVQARLPPGTVWMPLRYHRRPTLPATMWDAATGLARGLTSGRPDVIHARSALPALLAVAISRWKGAPWIYDVRGFLAQEYLDAGHWQYGSSLAWITGHIERRLLAAAHGLVFLTHRAAGGLLGGTGPGPERPRAVIPCAVDTERFAFAPQARARIRGELGLSNQPLAVYSGSLGSWYLPGEMLDFIRAAESALPELHFLVLTPQPAVMLVEAERHGLAKRVLVRSLSPAQVPDYLSAADFGISFIAPSPSKVASSPTKIAEYLACGLPTVLNSGVGDADDLADEPCWILVRQLREDGYTSAAKRVAQVLRQGDHREQARALANRCFSLADAVLKYDDLYRRVAEKGRH
jgi:glycosyltransferase involved in cell wall biosynthesis